MKVLTDNKYYGQIADVIREQNGTNNIYTPPQMVNALKDLFYEEAEGVPPITYNGIGENLLDYRIDGASGGVGDRTGNLAKWDTHLLPQQNGIVLNDLNSISSIIDVTSINNIYLYGDRTKLNSNAYRIGKSNGPISLNSQTTRITYTGNILDTSDCNYVIVSCSIYSTGTTFDDIKNSFMIVEGSSEPSVFEPYGYKVPVVISGKNLFDGDEPFLNSNTDTKTQMDIWFRLYNTSNLSISAANAVSNAQINQRIERVVTPNSDYNRLVVKHNGKTQDIIIISKVLEAGKNYVVSFDIKNNDVQTVGGIEISNIQIEEGSTATDYEPYIEPTTTNIYLDEPIYENESISLSDTNVNIPTIRGTNVLSIDTTVQPSNVYVKSRKESQYEIAMRQRYEGIIADYEQQLASIESSLQEV